MKVGVLGTGRVGKAIGTKLAGLGHDVMMGSRSADNADATAWATEQGGRASHGTFADAAAFGELLVNATAGGASLAVLESAGAEKLAGKVLIDIGNPLDFSKGMPPSLTVSNTDSLAEQIIGPSPTRRWARRSTPRPPRPRGNPPPSRARTTSSWAPTPTTPGP